MPTHTHTLFRKYVLSSLCLSRALSHSFSIYLYRSLSLYIYIYLSLSLSLSPPLPPPTIHPSSHPSTYASIDLSIGLLIYLMNLTSMSSISLTLSLSCLVLQKDGVRVLLAGVSRLSLSTKSAAEPYSDDPSIILRTTLRCTQTKRFAWNDFEDLTFSMWFSSGNTKIRTFTAWNRTRNRA